MIFQHTIDKVLSGAKTQTRRIVKPTHIHLGVQGDPFQITDVVNVTPVTNRGTIRAEHKIYSVGKTYAVQAARTMPGVWVSPEGVVIDGISDYDVWTAYSIYDAANELHPDFIYKMPDIKRTLVKHGYKEQRIGITGIRCEDVRGISDADARAEGFKDRFDFLLLWVEMHDKPVSVYWESDMIYDENDTGWYADELQQRPPERYQAWVLEFELVKQGNQMAGLRPLHEERNEER